MNNSKTYLVDPKALLTAMLLSLTISSAAIAHDEPRPFSAKITIHASPEIVWRSIHDERQSDDHLAYSKVLQQSGGDLTIEQKFRGVFGSSVCKFDIQEHPTERIDFKLVESNHFKSLDGSWILTPTSSDETVLEIRAAARFDFFMPKAVSKIVATKVLERRLNRVKEFAENFHDELEVNAKVL